MHTYTNDTGQVHENHALDPGALNSQGNHFAADGFAQSDAEAHFPLNLFPQLHQFRFFRQVIDAIRVFEVCDMIRAFAEGDFYGSPGHHFPGSTRKDARLSNHFQSTGFAGALVAHHNDTGQVILCVERRVIVIQLVQYL